MVRLLLSRGANINAFDKRDRRAIHWAAYMGNISQRFFLLHYHFCAFIFEDINANNAALESATSKDEAE